MNLNKFSVACFRWAIKNWCDMVCNMRYYVNYYPDEKKSNLTVRALDLVYTGDYPLILSAWLVSGYDKVITKNIIKIINESFSQWGEIRSRQRSRHIKRIKTKKGLYILLATIKKRSDWKNMPTYLYKQMLEEFQM